MDILSPELRKELGEDVEDLVILPSKKKEKVKKRKITKEMQRKMDKLNKKKMKKIQQLKEKKQKAKDRGKLFQSLSENKLSDAQMNLMHSTSKLGGTYTLKERLKRSYAMHQAGLSISSDAADELFQSRHEENEIQSQVVVPVHMKEEDQDDKVEEEQEQQQEVEETSMTSALEQLRILLEKNIALRTKTNETKSVELEQESLTAPYIPQPVDLDMLKKAVPTPFVRTKSVVALNRDPEIQVARMQLPVCSSEQEIMEAITENGVIIISGETGSGKTTQLPQFLYEAGFGLDTGPHAGIVGVTQPRRVAAMSTAKRVAQELNVPFGKEGHVGYQIRYDAEHVGPDTRIKFMTDGILLKEVQNDFLLKKYSAILLDEAHERNVNTDILIGLLSRIAPLRLQISQEETKHWLTLSEKDRKTATPPVQPLKLVIMSATLRIEDFTQNQSLFPTPPPVLRVEARQYPVAIHFNRRTELDDYVGAAYKKICKIHRRLPEGGILVFLTGQREIVQLCRKLKAAFTGVSKKATASIVSAADKKKTGDQDDAEAQADIEDAEIYGLETDSEAEDEDDSDDEEDLPAHVLPLYSLLSSEQQLQVFQPPPENHRLIVVATNVAETSLTIPGIKYVVDAGRSKERVYDSRNGISEFQVQWISKASANQRSGRAGRTGPGHCYRLYSSAVFENEFKAFSAPEILCRPVEDLILQMKVMGIEKVSSFPFPTPPDRIALLAALKTLVNLGAIDSKSAVTELGRYMSQFPIGARYAKMLLLAKHSGSRLLHYTIAMVASLSSGQTPFLHSATQEDDDGDEAEEWDDDRKAKIHAQWYDPTSDVLAQLKAVGACSYAGLSSEFCSDNLLHEKTMQQTLKLRQQLIRIANQMFETDPSYSPLSATDTMMEPPTGSQRDALRQILTAGFIDCVARRAPAGAITTGNRFEKTCAYISCDRTIEEPLYIHPHSHVFKADGRKLPEFIVYQNVIRTKRAYMKTVTVTEKGWLAALGKGSPLCKFSAPLEQPAPTYSIVKDQIECMSTARFGDHGWSLNAVKISYPIKESGDEYYRWLSRFLLDGTIFAQVSEIQKLYVESSSIATRRKYDKKTQLFLAALRRQSIQSRQDLLNHWKTKNPKFLQKEWLDWIRPEYHPTFLNVFWPQFSQK